jgi:hypothetical protein
MLAIMPASNAMELTPQISELLFKINPERVEFCLVFRRRGPADRTVPRDSGPGKPRYTGEPIKTDQIILRRY